MRRERPFRSITTAPTDKVVEVVHGLQQAIVQARWNSQKQAWFKEDNPLGRPLPRVTGWRPLRPIPSTLPKIL